MESFTNALNAILDLHTKKICKDTLMQFMRGKGHTNSEKRAINQEKKNDKSKMRCTKKGNCERSECPKIHIREKNFHCEQCDGRFYNFSSKTGHISQLVEKIFGCSTEKSYHESWD